MLAGMRDTLHWNVLQYHRQVEAVYSAAAFPISAAD